MSNLLSPKDLVLEVYKRLYREYDETAIDEFIDENYIQHNPQVKTGKNGFKEAYAFIQSLPRPKELGPPPRIIIEDKNYVLVHMDFNFLGKTTSVMDLFRVEGQKIMEHWDAVQYSPSISDIHHIPFQGIYPIQDLDKTAIHKEFIQDYLISRFSDKDPNPAHYLVHYILGEGNMVFSLSSGIQEGRPTVFYEIFRLKNGIVVEGWAVSQSIPEIMAHENGMI